MKSELTISEKQELEHRHRIEKDPIQRDRIRAVLLASEGWNGHQIAQALRVHLDTAYRYVKEYETTNKLHDNRGGSECRLSKKECEEVQRHIEDNLYETASKIALFINEKFGVSYSHSGMVKWLKRYGFTYKMPECEPAKKPPKEVQEAFIKEYEKLKESGEEIVFLDSSHPSQSTKPAQGWIRKGKSKWLKQTASRTRINLCGGLSLNHLATPVIESYKTINQKSIVDFLHKLRDSPDFSPDKTIHIILDGAGYHRAESVAEAAKKLNIQLHFLPPYCPNLNLIERLWKLLSKHVRNNQFFKNKKAFEVAIRRFFQEILPNLGDELISFFTDNFQVT